MVNGCDLIRSKWTQQRLSKNTMAWRPVTGARQYSTPQHSLTPYTRTRPYDFQEVDDSCVNIFSILPRFVKNLPGKENVVCSAPARTKSALVSFSFVQVFATFFQGIWHAPFRRERQTVHCIYTVNEKTRRSSSQVSGTHTSSRSHSHTVYFHFHC